MINFKRPPYWQLMAELLGTLESMEEHVESDFIRENAKERRLQLLQIMREIPQDNGSLTPLRKHPLMAAQKKTPQIKPNKKRKA